MGIETLVVIDEYWMSHLRMAEAPEGSKAIEKKAISGDRFGLIKDFMRYVNKGERRIHDVAKVGPASVDKCTMSVEEWDDTVKTRESTGQCKGVFFSTFGQRHMFRRCEEAADELCKLCKGMRDKARKDGVGCVTIEGQEEYEVVHKALFTRPGVVAAMTFWAEESEKMKKEGKMNKGFPYFTAQQAVELLMLTTGVIFANGGRSGRVYKRSQVIVRAQDLYLRESMQNVLLILGREKKKKFEQRFARLVKLGRTIHQQMLSAHEESDMPEVGALQVSDIVREELCRAARWAEQGTRPPKFLSNQVKRLMDWASERKRANKVAKTSGESAAQSPSTSPPSSVSSSPSSPIRQPVSKSRAGVKKALTFRRVRETEAVKPEEHGSVDEEVEESEVPIFKKFEIKQSTIPNAGEGLFLKEAAIHDEAIARYSGVLMSEEEAKKAASSYTVKIAANKYLVAEAGRDWEGCKANCARKARKICNARFAANGRCNVCSKTGKHWIKIFAVGDIGPDTEVLPDYGGEYWPEEGEEKLPTPKSNRRASSSSEQDRDSDSSWKPPASGKVTPKKKQASVIQESDSTKSRPAFKTKIYAVSIGRCVGLFRSAMRMQSSVFKYPGAVNTMFKSEQEANDFLIEKGVTQPMRFWKESYASGTLLQDPQSVVGLDVCFPVGVDMHDDSVQHGVVVEAVMREDNRMWKVQMDDGYVDYVAE